MKKIRAIAGVTGCVALAVLAHRIGAGNITAQLRNLGVVLPVVLLTGFARLLLQTRAWQIGLRAEGIEVPQPRLIAVRLASQAAGYLMALGPVVSEPAKLALLRSPAGMAAAAPATLFETGAFWFTTAILGLLGACAGAVLLAHARVVWLAVAIFSVGIWFLATRRTLLSPLVRAAGARAPKWLRSAEQAEIGIRSFRDRQKQAAGRVLILDSIAQVFTLIEVASVLWAAGIRYSLLQVLTIEAAGRVVKTLGAWVPGRIGMDEGGAAASFALLGFAPAAGLMLAAARRVRDLVWCASGVVWTAGANEAPMCVEEQ